MTRHEQSPQERILTIGNTLWFLTEAMVGPLFGLFSKKIGGDLMDIGEIYAVFIITTGLTSIWIGNLSKKKKIDDTTWLLRGFNLNAVAMWAFLLIEPTWIPIDPRIKLFLVQMMLGISMAMVNPTWNKLFEEAQGDWGFAVGLAQFASGISMLLATSIATYCPLGWNAVFVTQGCIQTIAAIYMRKLTRHRSVGIGNQK